MAEDESAPKHKGGRPKGAKDSKPRKRHGPDAHLTEMERKARRQMMLARRLTNHYIAEIAAEFRLSSDKVSRELRLAKREGMLDKAADYISTMLMPKALAVYANELDKGNTDVANKVLEFCGFGLKNNPNPVLVQVNTGNAPQEDFDAFRLRLAKQRLSGTTIIDVPVQTAAATGGAAGDGQAAQGRPAGDATSDAPGLGETGGEGTEAGADEVAPCGGPLSE